MRRGRMAEFKHSGYVVRLDHSASNEKGTYVVYSLSREQGVDNAQYVPDDNEYFTSDWNDAVKHFRMLAGDRAPLFIYGSKLPTGNAW